MSPPKIESATRTRSSPRGTRKSNESSESAGSSTTVHTLNTSAGKETDITESSPKKSISSSSSSSLPSSSSSGPLKGISKFLRSHKRHKSLDPSEIGSSSGSKHESQGLPDPSKSGSKSGSRSGSRHGSKSPLKSTILEEEEEQQQHQEQEQEIETNVSQREGLTKIPIDSNPITESYLKEVLGISLADWPYSEQLLISTISLKSEREKTKRESLRLSSLQNSIDLIKLSVESGIPPHLIPYVFLSGEQSREIMEKYTSKPHSESLQNQQQEPVSQSQHPIQRSSESQQEKQSIKTVSQQPSKNIQTSTSVFKVNIPQQTQFQFHHWQKPGESSSQSQSQQESEKKRKLSDDDSSKAQQQQQQQQHIQSQQTSSSSTFKPSTPNRITTTAPSSHRRNQSEASVSQLRSLYETQIMQHQQHQQPHPSQQQGQWSRTLGSPYYPSREPSRPLYFQYPPQQQQQQPTYSYPVQYIQGPPPPPPSGPPQGFAFPPRTASIGTPQRKETPVQQILPPPPQLGSGGVYSLSGPPPPPQVPPTQYRGGESMSASGSPVAMKRGGSGSEHKHGKSDVSFLISTPNNPPNR